MTPVAYYADPYKTFKKSLGKSIKQMMPKGHKPMSGPLTVRLLVTCTKPRTSKLDMPKPDIDNYMKAAFDAANKVVWGDDSQVRRVVSEKQWGRKPSIAMEVVRYEPRVRA